MVAVHERLHQEAVGRLGRVEGALDLLRVAVERLLAEHVLARLECPDRPLDVERVRQRDVDRIHARVREQGVVGALRALDPVLGRVGLPRFARGPARDRHGVDVHSEPAAPATSCG